MFEVIWQDETVASRRRLYGKLYDSTDAVSGKNITTTGVKAKLTKADGTVFTSTADIVLTNSANAPGRFYVELTQAECSVLGVIDGEVPASVPNGCLAASLHGEIVDFDPYADGASVSTIAAGVRTELATELARMDAAISSRLDAAGVRTAIGLAAANLDVQLDALPTATENADALLARNQKGGSNGAPTVAAALAAGLLEFTISGSTLTVKHGDGTTAFTRQLTRDATLLLGAIMTAS